MLKKCVVVDQNALSLQVYETVPNSFLELKLLKTFEIVCPDSTESVGSSYKKVNLVCVFVSVYETENLCNFEKHREYIVTFSELCCEKAWRADWFCVTSDEPSSTVQTSRNVPIFTLLLPMIKTGIESMIIAETIKQYYFIIHYHSNIHLYLISFFFKYRIKGFSIISEPEYIPLVQSDCIYFKRASLYSSLFLDLDGIISSPHHSHIYKYFVYYLNSVYVLTFIL